MAALSLVLALETGAAGWLQYQKPSEAGWSGQKLSETRRLAEDNGTASLMIVDGGVVVLALGEVDRRFPIYSMRKSLYNALIGVLVSEGKLELDATLRDLGVDEAGGLSEMERSATVSQLLSSRSGVYHVSAYEPSSMKRNRPERGSHPPGEYWFYNNWDFNVVAHLVEQASGRTVGEMFHERIATPLGMEDFSVDDVFLFHEPSRSRHPAPIFRMSGRDLARFGQLYLQGGIWEGDRIFEESWIEETWTPHTTFPASSSWGEGNGFGYMWWIHPGSTDEEEGSPHDIFLTRGSDGQVLAVIPSLDLVIAHQTDTESGQGGEFNDVMNLMSTVIAAKQKDTATAEAQTIALRPDPLPGALPAPRRRTAIAWSGEMIDALSGKYALSPQVGFLVHEVDGRLFALPKGVPLAEVELFVDETGVIFSPAVDVSLKIQERDQSRVLALVGQMEGREIRIVREPRRTTVKR